MIEGIEKLRQLEGMFGQISRFRGSNALTNDIRSLGGREPEFPDFVTGRAVKELREISRKDEACLVSASAAPESKNMVTTRTTIGESIRYSIRSNRSRLFNVPF